MRNLSLLLLTACAGAPSHPPTAAPPGVLTAAEALAACIESSCDNAEDLEACEAEHCADRPAAWGLVPHEVTYDGQNLTVSAAIEYAPARRAGVRVEREQEAYVGITAIRASGEEIDLAIQTLFPGRFEDQVLFLAEIGPDVRDIIFGLWDHKVEPCDSSRPGCRDFGFLLDGSLASWPPQVYQDGRRQRLLPPSITVKTLWAGMPPAEVQPKLDAIVRTLKSFSAPFHTEIGLLPLVLANKDAESSVVHRDGHDGPLASEVSRSLGGSIASDAEATADLVLTLGGEADEALWTCARACTSELAACLTSCP